MQEASHAFNPRNQAEEIEVEQTNGNKRGQHNQDYLPLLDGEVGVIRFRDGSDGVCDDVGNAGQQRNPREGRGPALDPGYEFSDYSFRQYEDDSLEAERAYSMVEQKARTSARRKHKDVNASPMNSSALVAYVLCSGQGH